ncbi:MAG: HD domain-containing protein [Alphaproteobacteria bacterium]|nr:HD domain-containing protein [Alphaproteobacteria bacterium]
MQIYLVGGALRDKFLGRPGRDKDFVVVGGTEEEMLQQGYKKVGKKFPVFLHPKTGEEYALARKEIKIGAGHKNFNFIFSPDITLEEDALRRDFTCNALYENISTGEIIDYHHGREDIKHHILRHVSEHFVEDPLRILRMCRFAAQLNFAIAPETMTLSKKMVEQGELQYLSKDRIWQEFYKALNTNNFHIFIEAMRCCGALKVILPEMEEMFSIPERLDFHPEGNSGAHTLLALQAASSDDPLVNYAVLLHDIGKIKTDPQCWPSHHRHDAYGVAIIKEIGKRLHVPVAYTEFAATVAQHHMVYHQKIVDVQKELVQIAIKISRSNSKHDQQRFIQALKADMQGRGKKNSADEIKKFAQFERYFKQLIEAVRNKKVSELPEFEVMIAAIKKGTMPPIELNHAYIKTILAENPYVSD